MGQGLNKVCLSLEFQRPPPKEVVLLLEMLLTDTEMETVGVPFNTASNAATSTFPNAASTQPG